MGFIVPSSGSRRVKAIYHRIANEVVKKAFEQDFERQIEQVGLQKISSLCPKCRVKLSPSGYRLMKCPRGRLEKTGIKWQS